MIRFACPSCGMAVSAPDDCAGRRTKCRRCSGPMVVPHIEPETSASEDVPPLRSTVEKAAPLIALMVAATFCGFVGLFVWKSSGPPQSASSKQIARAISFSSKTEAGSAKIPSETRRGEAKAFQAQKRGTAPPKHSPSKPKNTTTLPSDFASPPPPLLLNQEPAVEKAPPGPKTAEPPPPQQAQTPKPQEKTSSSPQPPPPAQTKALAAPPSESRAKQQQKNDKKDDLPDVSLVVPEEAAPELKAILKSNALALGSQRSSERLRAAQALGELGEKGKPVRGLLCKTMLLDPMPAVRVAAADALKNIDAKMHYLAVALLTEKKPIVLHDLLAKIQKLEDDGAPLAPLIAYGAIVAAQRGDINLLVAELTALSHIARNDLAAYKLIATALANRNALVRAAALQALVRMKHGKQAVPQMIALLKTDADNRIIIIETLTTLADDSTEEVIRAAISAHRYDDNALVRRAVETALNKLENKKQSP